MNPTNDPTNETQSIQSNHQIKTSKQNKRQSKTFVCKLYEILQTSSIQSNPLISWSSLGERFYVNNPIEFSKLILPLYFKHNNWPSFIRQLNMYGFHKVHHSSTSDHPWEFRHPNFRKGRSDLISLIQRKSTKNENKRRKPMNEPILPSISPQFLPSDSSFNSMTNLSMTIDDDDDDLSKRTSRYDPVRDPGAVNISSNHHPILHHPHHHHHQISHVLKRMLGLISKLVKDSTMNSEIEQIRLEIIKLEESLIIRNEDRVGTEWRIERVGYEGIEDVEEMEGIEGLEDEEVEDVEEEEEEIEVESDLSRDSRSV